MSNTPDKPSPFSGRGRPTLIALGIICLVGMTLRLWGIQHESAWWDEYSSLMHLHQPSLWDFLQYNRTNDPATLPLYYVVEYFWSRLAGTGTLAMRVPSLFLGVLLIPAVYALGARSLGQGAGLFAAACVALSPIHAFHAQGIRMYVLFTLLAVCSMYAFVRLREGGTRWWAVHAVVQFLLSWTHPFALLLLPVQGAAWLATGGHREWRRVFAWGTVCLLACAPALAYLSQVQYWAEDSTAGWFAAPTLLGVMADMVADDVVSATYQLRVSPQAYGGVSALLAARPAFDPLLVFAFAGLALLAAAKNPARKHTLLLVLWCVLPVLVLFLASLAFRPMLFPRYTVHASIALYLLAGAGLASIPLAPLRRVVAMLALGLLAYQVGLVHPGPQRSDYLGVAAKIAQEGTPSKDIVLVQDHLWRDVFAYNAPELNVPILSFGDAPALAALGASHYLGGIEGAVWLLASDDYFDSTPDDVLEASLRDAGLAFERTRFFGIHDLYLYKVFGTGSLAAADRWAALARSTEDTVERRDLLATLNGVAATLATQGAEDKAATLIRAYANDAPENEYTYGVVYRTIAADPAKALLAFTVATDVVRALGLLENGHPGLAADALLALSPNPNAPALLTTALLELALVLPARAEPLVHAVLETPNPPEARYFHLLDTANTTGKRDGCGPLMALLLESARPLSPLHFELNCSAIERACARGEAIVTYIDAKVRMDEGMTYFEQQNYAAAAEAFKAASVDQFGFPVMMLGVLDLMQGNKQGFRDRARVAIDMDPGLKAVTGAWLEALLNEDRPRAEAAALEFRGTDLDISDILLGLTATYFDGAPSPA